MPKAKRSLEGAVLEVFEYACQQQDLEVAEHLLRALEIIAQRSGEKDQLNRALLRFAHSLPGGRFNNS